MQNVITHKNTLKIERNTETVWIKLNCTQSTLMDTRAGRIYSVDYSYIYIYNCRVDSVSGENSLSFFWACMYEQLT